jgi:hypothetical protein
MAKEKTTEALEPAGSAGMVLADDLMGTMERPKSLIGDLSGTEDITGDELRLPRLAIAQGLSDQMMPDNGLYIPELKLFDMFNDLTSTVYGRGPIRFVPIRRDVRRIEFIPRSEGGGIKDRNVPPGDRRLDWTEGPDGRGIPPVATQFDEYVAMLLINGRPPEPIVISIKHTNKWNRRAVSSFLAYIKISTLPLYAGIYTIASKTEKNDKGTFGVPLIKQAGFLDVEGNPQAKKFFEECRKFALSLEGKDIAPTPSIHRETDVEFNPDNM